MNYISLSDIEDRLGSAHLIQLTYDSGSGSADNDRINATGDAAEAEVNSHLAQRYAVPIDLALHPASSALLKSFVLDLVEYCLHGRRPPVHADVIRRHDEAQRWLRRIALGEIQLVTGNPVAMNPATEPLSGTTGQERAFSRETLENL